MNRSTPDAWQRVKAVFAEAAEQPVAERRKVLDRACGDEIWLRREVESLLATDELASGFMQKPAAALLRAPGQGGTTARALTPGLVLGSYEILGLLGAGGMSQVYRARDTRLGRTVAIKVVAADSADPAAGRRLLREARHASSLGHPHICTIHEVGEVDGLPFIVMEHIEGRPLNELLKDGPLPPQEVRRFGLQIADALAHAHQRRVVHRDLKSSNVVIGADGRAIVLDFGLSRLLPGDAAGHLSSASLLDAATLAGTLSYMAPEVLCGAAADPRGDIWALGVLLYEMATGTLPFRGDTPFETSNAILHNEPAPVGSHVPLGLRLIVQRCLVKDPARRYQSAEQVLASLQALDSPAAAIMTAGLLLSRHRRRIGAGAAVLAGTAAALLLVSGARDGADTSTVAPIQTLTVLPLRIPSGAQADDYFTDGITEALIALMGNVDGVRVLSRTTAMKYRGSAKTVREIAHELGADAVLEGSAERSGDRLHLNVRLTAATTGHVLWSETYERSIREVVALLHDVVRAVASHGHLSMHDAARVRLSSARAVDPVVYEAYLKGRYYWNQRTDTSLSTAISYFKQAIELDPTYAAPYAALADCYNQLATQMLGAGSPQKWRPEATRLAIKALQIDPDLAEAHATLGYVRHYNWDWDQAERAFRRALELNPSNALARIWYANYLVSRRRLDDAVREVMLARELDPLSLIVNTNVGWTLTFAGRYEEAIAQLRRTLELDPTYVQAHRRLGSAYAGAGRFEEAIAALEAFVSLADRTPSSLATLAEIYAAAGRREDARRLLTQVLGRAQVRYVPPGGVASVYLRLGEPENAFPWLERAYDERSNYMAYTLVDRSHDSIRSDPRYRDLLRRVGLLE